MSSIQPVKPTMLMLLALFLLSFGVGSIRCAMVPENSTDMLSLLEFKQIIAKNQGDILSYWNNSTPFCQWNGVTCATKHPGRVTALNLTGQGLSGPIATSVGNLTFLRILDLSANYFSGQIPPLSNLHKLQFLDLSRNTLEGNFPDWLTNCSTLSFLDLSKNTLVGTIPPKISLLSNLEELGLSVNNFTGTIPPTLKNITNLRKMVIASNQLEGTIPSALGQLSNLQILSLADNNISGEIPHPFYNLSSLQQLSLRDNKLGKALAPDIGDKLPNLVSIIFQDNMFEGNIPASLGNASGLTRVYLSSNVFTGPVPSSFGKLSGLLTLNLDENDLEASDRVSWAFLHALGNCSSLQVLSLAKNKLTGPIPDSIGNLSKTLQNLVLGGNKLSGIVPDNIGKLSGLIILTLDSNFLTGTIGEWIGKLKHFQVLILESNNFVGPIPSSIGNLTQLGILQLRNNRFQGPIPPSLGSLSLLTSLDLSYNNLQGNIPVEIGFLRQLVNLTLSSNRLTGGIPDSLSECKNLVNISMDRNFFTGEVPPFGNIVGLLALNLSHNNLSGTIPKTLSDLQLLKSLDLSYNHLYGEIPTNGVFADATSVSLGGNWGLCGGTKDLHMPSCPSPTVSHRMSKQYYLIRILIPIFGFMSLILLIYFVILEKKSSRRKYSEQTSFSENFLKVSYNDLAQATTNFSESNLIGRGAHGSVYRGRLKEPKIEVAVKVFNLEMHGAERSFMSECEALRSIQHRNLLPIITACSTVDQTGDVFKALVYEFMPNGSLDSWLHHRGDGKASKGLRLSQRMNIAVNVADALDYLHHDCGRPTVHCDLKPNNILLDDDMTALLGDFGIARFYVDSFSTTAGSVNSVGLKGTIGYIAPEYAHGGHVSPSGDVYSFGIVLLEMITGKRPTDPMFKDGIDIINYVNNSTPRQVLDIIDDHLKEECKDYDQPGIFEGSAVYQCMVSLLELARSCTRQLPSERANMKQIASKLHTIRTSYLGWKQKTASLD